MSCNRTICSIWNECDEIIGSELKPLCASESMESLPTDKQQLKPKMPSYAECINAIGGITSEPVVSPSSAVIGAKRMYDYLARHFGH